MGPSSRNGLLQPGHKLAWGIAHNIITKYIEIKLPPRFSIPSDSSGVNPGEIDDDKLVKAIDEWLNLQPEEKAITFVLYLIYGVPQRICGYIAHPDKNKTEDAYRNWWQEQYNKMLKSLRKYLEGKLGL